MSSPWPVAFSMIGASGDTGPQGPSGSDSSSFNTIYTSPQFVSSGPNMASSPDGLSWTGGKINPFPADPVSGTPGEGRCVAWNGSYWLAGGFNWDRTVTMAKSLDGDTWSSVTNHLDYEVNGIASNGEYWIAVGRNIGTPVSIIKSSDGITWTPSTNNPFGAGGGHGIVTAIAWNGTQWRVLGSNSGSTPITLVSSDGMTWVTEVIVSVHSCISTNGSLWVIGGSGGIQSSSDGITWSSLTGFTSICTSIAWNGSMFVACGIYNNSSPNVMIASSSDGLTWTDSTWAFSGGSPATSVAWNGSIWVVTYRDTGGSATSSDGLDWQAGMDYSLNILGTQRINIITQYFPSITTRSLYLQSGTAGATSFQSTINFSMTSTFTSTIIYTGVVETFTIPEGTSSIKFDVLGGGGANLGGGGAYVSGTYSVQTGDENANISIVVGQGGQFAATNALGAAFFSPYLNLTFTSGGAAQLAASSDPMSVGGGGGGASGIVFPNGVDCIVVGAGAGGYAYGTNVYRGGDGGIITGSEPAVPLPLLTYVFTLTLPNTNFVTEIQVIYNPSIGSIANDITISGVGVIYDSGAFTANTLSPTSEGFYIEALTGNTVPSLGGFMFHAQVPQSILNAISQELFTVNSTSGYYNRYMDNSTCVIEIVFSNSIYVSSSIMGISSNNLGEIPITLSSTNITQV